MSDTIKDQEITSQSASASGSNVSHTVAQAHDLAPLIASASRWSEVSNAKKTSNVWKIFDLFSKEDARDNPPLMLRCILCSKPSLHTRSRVNGSNSMLQHFQRPHKNIFTSYKHHCKAQKKRKRQSRNTTINEL